MYKNLAQGRELDGDVLRQRRDLYATALGLILFHLAGAGLRDDAVLTTVPVHLARPEVLYWAAFAALLYFLFRYWMVAPSALERFDQEWRLQTLGSGKYLGLLQRIAARYLENSNDVLNYVRAGMIPDFDLKARTIRWNQFQNLRRGGQPVIPGLVKARVGVSMIDDEFEVLQAARRRGFVRAVFFERTAMDIMAPYVIAFVAILFVIYSLLHNL
jgi:hypothetical protein